MQEPFVTVDRDLFIQSSVKHPVILQCENRHEFRTISPDDGSVYVHVSCQSSGFNPVGLTPASGLYYLIKCNATLVALAILGKARCSLCLN